MNHVIIGGGIAGTTAAEEIRKLDATSNITIVSSEYHALYSRVLLPHYVRGKVLRERVFLKKEEWYDAQKIEWLHGETVLKIDTKNQCVELSSGREIPYDKLLIATGGDVKLIEEDRHGVSYFRTLDDADHLIELLHSCRGVSCLPAGMARPSPAASIYGGGFIACEYLNIFHDAGFKTRIAFRGNHMWSRALSNQAGEIITNHLITNHVEVVPNVASIETQGEKTIESFSAHGKTFPCSILGIGVGIQPDFSFLKGSDIETNQGILANQFLETSARHVYAIGDVAEFFDERYGRHIIAGNWMNAQMQGRLVAKNMLGERNAFNLVSSYATNTLGLEIIFIGDASRPHADSSRLIGSVESGGSHGNFCQE